MQMMFKWQGRLHIMLAIGVTRFRFTLAYDACEYCSTCIRVIHRRPIKNVPLTFVHIYANYWPIFEILSLAHSADNLQ